METFYDRAANAARAEITKLRWALGLHGLASAVVGVMILAWPGISVYALAIVFGAFSLVTGIFEFGTAFTSQGKEERGWLIVRGLAGMGIGVLVLAWPGISALALLYVIAGRAIVTGALEIAAAIELRKVVDNEWLMALGGLASIVFGVALIALGFKVRAIGQPTHHPTTGSLAA